MHTGDCAITWKTIDNSRSWISIKRPRQSISGFGVREFELERWT
jgi:hypothetical protein